MKPLIFIAIFISSIVTACTANAFEYMARVDSVYDGDTIKVTAEVWPGLFKKTSVRIIGIDTPELRTKNMCEKALALKAKAALSALIGDTVIISNVQNGKYAGRVLANVGTLTGADVGAYMVGEGYARPYHGGKRQPWCVQ